MLERTILRSFAMVFTHFGFSINSLSQSIKLLDQKPVFTTIGGDEDDRGSGRITPAVNLALLY